MHTPAVDIPRIQPHPKPPAAANAASVPDTNTPGSTPSQDEEEEAAEYYNILPRMKLTRDDFPAYVAQVKASEPHGFKKEYEVGEHKGR